MKTNTDDEAAAAVEKCWREFWRPLVINDRGHLNLENVKKELFDYWQVMERVPEVYCHITGNKVSKVLTDPRVVCSLADEHYAELAEPEEEPAFVEGRTHYPLVVPIICLGGSAMACVGIYEICKLIGTWLK